LGLGLFIALSGCLLWAAEAPPEVIAAAKEGLPGFLSLIPTGSKPLYGFPEDINLAEARLGTPVLLHVFKRAVLQSNQVSQTVSSALADTSMWFFPVLLAGEGKAMLVVDWHQNAWKAVSLGYAHLGSEWNQVSKQWPLAKGFHPQLVAVLRANEHYFTVPEVDDRNLTRIIAPWDKLGPPNAPSVTATESPDRYSRLGSLASELESLKSRLVAAPPASAH
jgi:hypothetical protein